MNGEVRIIKSSIMTGWTEIFIGLIMHFTGWQQWYFENFHFFGMLGMGMLIYGVWHNYYYNKETKKVINFDEVKNG